jgi:hypothetical protein
MLHTLIFRFRQFLQAPELALFRLTVVKGRFCSGPALNRGNLLRGVAGKINL